MGSGAGKSQQPTPAPCQKPGCGKPSWNGKPGEFCCKACSRPPTCARSACGKPSWNGKDGEYCGKFCKDFIELCATKGCGKPSWNNQAGEYCSKACQNAPATCATAGCSKPTWNGLAGEYCSIACKTGIATAPSASSCIPQGGASGKSVSSGGGATAGFLCLRPGCGKFSHDGEPGEYCSTQCRDIDPGICMQVGCGKPTWNGKFDDYCSKECRETRICVRPGCGKTTWNGTPNEYCSFRCRKLGPPNEPVAAAVSSSDPKPKPESMLVEITDPQIITQIQVLLNDTRKDTDNWTRDRGCTIHGRGDPACNMKCAFANQVPVPNAYEIVKVEFNMNAVLWDDYAKARDGILQECQSQVSGGGFQHYQDVPLATNEFTNLGSEIGAEPLVSGCNEWRLFHGTGVAACKGICDTNFQVTLSGSGATWKNPGSNEGKPLYGYGIYLAERITKADEYAEHHGPDDDHYCILVCRVIGGRAKVIQTDRFDTDRLQRDISGGKCDSVVGDRETKLNKPYKEIVIYNGDQVFPEFLITYKRL